MNIAKFRKDHVAALLVIVIGVATAGVGATYRIGSLQQMGAGLLPVVFGALMALVGIAIGLSAGRIASVDTPAPEPRPDSPWRGWLCIVGGVVAFVVLGSHGGLVPAAFFSVSICALGDRDNTLRSAVALGAVITAFSVLIFHYGLQVQLPLFQWN